ncbi:hypothetical protein [Streptomyces sp. HPF1205]|uniref:hypothetical protein n=1 Tax=Streptomyces sp. HPF1205 TaxID=2873262 RepID=UPI001CEC33F6|nr:hypothetical protein [Streptomyces sp. HPF1205]
MSHSTARGPRNAANLIPLFIRENTRDAIDINCLVDLFGNAGKVHFHAEWHALFG